VQQSSSRPQTNAVAFESNLAENAQIVLKAPTATNQIQVWRLNLGRSGTRRLPAYR